MYAPGDRGTQDVMQGVFEQRDDPEKNSDRIVASMKIAVPTFTEQKCKVQDSTFWKFIRERI